MGRSNKRKRENTGSKNWRLILAAVIPVWAVVMFVGWFVISTLVPMLGSDQTDQIANDKPEKAIIDFNTAAGDNGNDKNKSNK